jgi:hypothetical protein
VPGNLNPAQGEKPTIKATGRGAQVYVCQLSATDPNKFEWNLKAPDAQLLNDKGEKIGSHYAGPTWESPDGSRVVGEVRERADSPDANAIPWLLLKAKSNDGKGIFSSVTSIQRVDTIGGKAPATGCGSASANAEVRVDYSATYYFYAR